MKKLLTRKKDAPAPSQASSEVKTTAPLVSGRI